MAVEVKIPDLGDGVESGDVLEVFVSEGETVEKGQDLIELETDKATVSVPSDAAGTISKIHVSEGDTVAVGGLIVSLEGSAAAAPAVEEAPAETASEPAVQAAPATPPKTVVEKVEPAAPSAPAKPAPAVAKAAPPAAAAPSSSGSSVPANQVAAGPAIRRLAREVGIDLGTVTGSGDLGRITRDDLMQAVRSGGSQRSATAVSAGQQSDGHGPVRIEKMPKIRQTIARKMHESWETCPRVTNFDDADITELEEIRQSSKKDYAEQDIKLTTMPFLIKAVAKSLKDHPVINASVDLEEGKIIYKEYVNVGIAVDTDRGLVVPSLRSADQLGIPEIARKLSDMATSVRNNDFSIEDLRGGTFTISNLGAIGGTYSTPIINVPETAILLIGRSRKMPVVVDDEIKIRLMMPLSISYDHRLIDGAAAARFLNEVKGYLEAPSRLLLAL